MGYGFWFGVFCSSFKQLLCHLHIHTATVQTKSDPLSTNKSRCYGSCFGAITLPLYISLLHSSLATLTWIYLSIDIITGEALVASIAVISLERLYAIGFPWKHRLLKRKHYAIGIMSTWMYAIVFMFFIRFVAAPNGIVIMRVHVLIWGMGVPLLITIVSCIMICIVKKRSQRSLRQQPNVHKDNKLVKTLLLITVVFWLTWLPYTVLSVINSNILLLKGKVL